MKVLFYSAEWVRVHHSLLLLSKKGTSTQWPLHVYVCFTCTLLCAQRISNGDYQSVPFPHVAHSIRSTLSVTSTSTRAMSSPTPATKNTTPMPTATPKAYNGEILCKSSLFWIPGLSYPMRFCSRPTSTTKKNCLGPTDRVDLALL